MQAEILSELEVDIVVAFDKDINEDEIRINCSRLKEYAQKNIYYIIDKDDLLDEKDSPADKGNKVYQQLFQNKILYAESECKTENI